MTALSKNALHSVRVHCLVLLALLGFALRGFAAVTIAWDPNDEEDLAGYKLYFGPLHSVARCLDVGNRTSIILNDLEPGVPYYFYATAYNVWGLESEPSKPLFHTKPFTIALPLPEIFFGKDYEYSVTYEEAAGSPSQTVRTTGSRFNLDHLEPGKTYLVYLSVSNVLAGTTVVSTTTLNVPENYRPSAGEPLFELVAPSAGRLQRVDAETQGAWRSVYGSEGWLVLGDTAAYPGDLILSAIGKGYRLWSSAPESPAALDRADSSGKAAAEWYNKNEFRVNLAFETTTWRRVAVYCLDYASERTEQSIDLLEMDTGQLLESQKVTSFQEGVYVVFEVRGRVAIRAKAIRGGPATISGIFFDPVPEWENGPDAPAPDDPGPAEDPPLLEEPDIR